MVSGSTGDSSQSCDGRPTCVLEEFGCHGVVEVQVHVLVLQRTRNPPPHQRVSQLRRLEGGGGGGGGFWGGGGGARGGGGGFVDVGLPPPVRREREAP
eukprot:COSAG04_NODE_5802_length_1488_cov_6.581713_1_plen_97_part_10